MTRPITASKVLLVADRQMLVADRRTAVAGRHSAPVRRYRLARLRLDARLAPGETRFEYLKRTYD
jgi:hypothetical protein